MARTLLSCLLSVGFGLLVLGCQSPEPERSPSPQAGPPGMERGPRGPGPQGAPPGGRGGRVGVMELSTEDAAELEALCAQEPELEHGGWAGLVHDAHIHVPLGVNQGDFALALLRDMNSQGIGRAMVQPDHAPELTQNPGLMQAMRRQDAFWGRLASHCPRIVPMIYGFDPSQEESVDYVAELLATGHYGGVGEIEFRHVRMAIAHAPDSPALQAIYSMLAERGLTFHFQAELRHDQALGERVRAVVAGHPELRFVWFGCSPEMLEWNLDNLWCGGFLHPQLPRPGSRMVRRTLFGSDTGPAGFPAASAPALPYQDLEVALDRAREVLGGLPPSDAAAAAHGNFEAALPARR